VRDISAATQPWIRREKRRMVMLLREVLARQLAGDLTRRSLIHGDFHPENILIRGHLVSVIDFEHGAMGDPAMDLGYFLAELDIQADRYWSRRGQANPIDVDRLSDELLARYSVGARLAAHSMVPVYRARTYLKHLVHTIRMMGTEPADSVSRWLQKAEHCLAAESTVPVLRARMAKAALPLRPARTEPPITGHMGPAI
jgi:aminoglycoside phosphotransferase (APT) family kinase protein